MSRASPSPRMAAGWCPVAPTGPCGCGRRHDRDRDPRQPVVALARRASGAPQALGSVLAQTLAKVGLNGPVMLDAAGAAETRLEILRGVRLNRGYHSPFFITDALQLEAILEAPFVLVSDQA